MLRCQRRCGCSSPLGSRASCRGVPLAGCDARRRCLIAEQSFARAMELCDLVELMPADDVREREVAEARARWAKVRAWAARHRGPRARSSWRRYSRSAWWSFDDHRWYRRDRGVPRLTRDVDAVVEGAAISTSDLAAELAEVGIVPRIADAVGFAAETLVFRARHAARGVDIDVSRGWLPFELEALAAASVASLAGVRVVVARAEDLVIFKAIAWRPQDQQDVERLLALHANTIDLARSTSRCRARRGARNRSFARARGRDSTSDGRRLRAARSA
jgi:hypothetical protein